MHQFKIHVHFQVHLISLIEKWEKLSSSEVVIVLDITKNLAKLRVHNEIINTLWDQNQRRPMEEKLIIKELLEKSHSVYLNTGKRTIYFKFKGREEAEAFLGQIIFTKNNKYKLQKPLENSPHFIMHLQDVPDVLTVKTIKQIFQQVQIPLIKVEKIMYMSKVEEIHEAVLHFQSKIKPKKLVGITRITIGASKDLLEFILLVKEKSKSYAACRPYRISKM